ncbi:hypothetical protein D3C86_2265110 [compost metagenome]
MRVQVAAAVPPELRRKVGARYLAFIDHIHLLMPAAEEFIIFVKQRNELVHEQTAVLMDPL